MGGRMVGFRSAGFVFFLRLADGVAADLKHSCDRALGKPLAQSILDLLFLFLGEVAFFGVRCEGFSAVLAPEPLRARAVTPEANEGFGLLAMRAGVDESNHTFRLQHQCAKVQYPRSGPVRQSTRRTFPASAARRVKPGARRARRFRSAPNLWGSRSSLSSGRPLDSPRLVFGKVENNVVLGLDYLHLPTFVVRPG